MDVDLRSEARAELKKIDEAFATPATRSSRRTDAINKEGRIEADLKVIGERPCGETPMDAPIVQARPRPFR